MKTNARWVAYVLIGSVLVLSVSRVLMKQGGDCKTTCGMGVPPMNHGQDAHATLTSKVFAGVSQEESEQANVSEPVRLTLNGTEHISTCAVDLFQPTESALVAHKDGFTNNCISLTQESFSLINRNGAVDERIIVKSVEGTVLAWRQLPDNVRQKILDLDSRGVPRAEMNPGCVRDIFEGFYYYDTLSVEEKMRMVSGTYRPKRTNPPDWVQDILLGGGTLSCFFEIPVPLIEFYSKIGKAVDCEFGVTERGEIIFLNMNATKQRNKQGVFLIKYSESAHVIDGSRDQPVQH